MRMEEAAKKASENREKVAAAWTAYLQGPSKETFEAYEKAWEQYQAPLSLGGGAAEHG